MPSPIMQTMNVLNTASSRFPDAISFAAGRPPDRFLETHDVDRWIERFVQHSAMAGARAPATVRSMLGQYSNTNGIILDLLQRHLLVEECIDVPVGACMVTNGAQEALLICLLGVVGRDRTVIATDPTYVGLSGAAEATGTPCETIDDVPHMIGDLRRRLEIGKHGGLPVGAVYVIPDFSNPLGTVMPLEDRVALLELARSHDFYIIEDAAYRAYRYDGVSLPTIKSLDRGGRVIYIESFSKTFLPGARLAVLVADDPGSDGALLAERLSWIKSYTSVATPPLLQAALGGFLLEHDFVMGPRLAARREWCRCNRDTMLAALIEHCGSAGSNGIHWNVPAGGFFLGLRLAQEFGHEEFLACAAAGVLVIPMTFFSPHGRYRDHVRLAFSNVEPARITAGIRLLAGFLSGA